MYIKIFKSPDIADLQKQVNKWLDKNLVEKVKVHYQCTSGDLGFLHSIVLQYENQTNWND